ncbi:Oligopeptide transporter 3 [Capsicum baccatum]|uniref:Oligopeptide transporter 3 n=1 Tax=Capsicum baccatum TaxID=33114 RepID=A0A2G2VA49_CAPBA|nr:Oligopeptide transporter 3 [Capsicum baccatum]
MANCGVSIGGGDAYSIGAITVMRAYYKQCWVSLFSHHRLDYSASGHKYDTTKIFTPQFHLNISAYEKYSKLYLSPLFALSIGSGFARFTATLTHVALFQGSDIWNQSRSVVKNVKMDIHAKLMKSYKQVSQCWFLVLLVGSVALSLLMCFVWKKDVQLLWWGMLFAFGLAFIVTLPIGVIQATTNQLVGTLVAGTINLAVAWWMLGSIENIGDVETLHPDSPWTSSKFRVTFDASVIWGLIGPQRLFGPGGLYRNLVWLFLIEALAAQYAADSTLKRVYADQKDDDSPLIEPIIAPEIKMYKNDEQKRTREREVARLKISLNRVATVVANEWKDDNDKVMHVKQWLEERKLLQITRTMYSKRQARGVRENRLKLRLKTLEEGLTQATSDTVIPNGSPKPQKTNHLFSIFSSNAGLKKRSTSQPRSCSRGLGRGAVVGVGDGDRAGVGRRPRFGSGGSRGGRLDSGGRLRVGSWNIGTLQGSKAREVDGYKLWYSGSERRRNGVGILVDEELRGQVVEVKRINDRLMTIKLVIWGFTLNVCSAYAPQVGSEGEEKMRFWEALEEVVRGVPSSEKIVIAGDFNGHIGALPGGFGDVHGGFGFGERNEEGTTLLEFARSFGLVVVNSGFPKKDDHLITF